MRELSRELSAISDQPSAVSLIRRLFEGAEPLIGRLVHGGPYAGTQEIVERARAVLPTLSEAEQIAVINAHPRIGEPPARVRAQSELSYREQGYDRDTTAPETLERLRALNAQYERRFGFRFVVFVNRRPKAALIPVLEARLRRSRAEELATALAEILAVAEDRLRRSEE